MALPYKSKNSVCVQPTYTQAVPKMMQFLFLKYTSTYTQVYIVNGNGKIDAKGKMSLMAK